jgi:hypothetical protein
MSKNGMKARRPWASGPAEILQHGINLLREDNDRNRRLAILSIDNAVELMIKTYLGLPRRVTGLPISRAEYSDVAESFPKLLDSLEKHCPDKLEGIELSEVEWYHRLRNQLYHQGNGLTVEREKVEFYAELAQLLFERLFGFELEIEKSESTTQIGEFIKTWAEIEVLLSRLVAHNVSSSLPGYEQGKTGQGSHSVLNSVRMLSTVGVLSPTSASELRLLNEFRNGLVHGKVESIDVKTVRRATDLREALESHVIPSRRTRKPGDGRDVS